MENNAIELTDDPQIDDGIDLDGDGNTLDDDPTNITVLAYEPPTTLTEDFADDNPGNNAIQYYFDKKWFETSNEIFGNSFEVTDSYSYLTDNAFKTKIRSSNSSHYWNYSVSDLNSSIIRWEIWFRCANTSEQADLYLYFKNQNGNDIITLKFEYIIGPADDPNEWILKFSYKTLSGQWIQLSSDYEGGYLHDDWYKLKIEKGSLNNVIYYLYRYGQGVVDTQTDQNLGKTLSDLSYIEWKNTINTIVSPIFIWDDHTVTVINYE
jgi:hypothetical protein